MGSKKTVFQFIYLFIRYIPYHTTVAMQQCQEKRQEGKNEEKKDRGRGRNHPPQPRQLMRIWGKKKRQKTEGTTKERNREWAPTQLPGL